MPRDQGIDGRAGRQGASGKKKAAKPRPRPRRSPGKPVTGDESGADAPALLGTAEGRFAPGWTVQETTEVAAGSGRGLQGVNCTAPDTEFWFPGASTADDRTDYVHLTNPDDSAAVVDIELYGKDGALKSTVGEGITVQPHSSDPVLLSTLTDEQQTNLTVHVTVAQRPGRRPPCRPSTTSSAATGWPRPPTRPAAWCCPASRRTPPRCAWSPSRPATTDADLKVQLASPDRLDHARPGTRPCTSSPA